MSIKSWFERLNRRQRNVVVAASGLSLLSIIGHWISRPYSSMGWIYSTDEFVFIISLVILIGAIFVFVFRDE
jgi:hypothetical protein